MMQVPTVGSKVKIKLSFSQGKSMIPPIPSFIEYEGIVLHPYKWLTDREFCLSGDKDWPVRVIAIDRVLNLELVSGELKTLNLEHKVYNVNGSKGNKYIVTKSKSKWDCTCPGFSFRKTCKHVVELSKE